MTTMQPRKNRAGWLSLGWLTDKELVDAVKLYKADLEDATGVQQAMSHCVKALLRDGLKVHGRMR